MGQIPLLSKKVVDCHLMNTLRGFWGNYQMWLSNVIINRCYFSLTKNNCARLMRWFKKMKLPLAKGLFYFWKMLAMELYHHSFIFHFCFGLKVPKEIPEISKILCSFVVLENHGICKNRLKYQNIIYEKAF